MSNRHFERSTRRAPFSKPLAPSLNRIRADKSHAFRYLRTPMASLFIIDGFNVLHAGILTGRDRANWWHVATQQRLITHIEQGTYTPATALWIVFDRRSERHMEEQATSKDSRLQIFYAPSADDWIVTQVAEHAHEYAITVVTADRPLRERVRRVGGMLCSPLQFLATCG